MAEPEIHDVPQIHRAVLLRCDAQQPPGTVIAAGRGVKHLVRQLANKDEPLHTARQPLWLDFPQHGTINHAAGQPVLSPRSLLFKNLC